MTSGSKWYNYASVVLPLVYLGIHNNPFHICLLYDSIRLADRDVFILYADQNDRINTALSDVWLTM